MRGGDYSFLRESEDITVVLDDDFRISLVPFVVMNCHSIRFLVRYAWTSAFLTESNHAAISMLAFLNVRALSLTSLVTAGLRLTNLRRASKISSVDRLSTSSTRRVRVTAQTNRRM